MRRRLISLLLVFMTAFGGVIVQEAVIAPQSAAAGIISTPVRGLCDITDGSIVSVIGADPLCKLIGDAAQTEANKAFDDVWNSLIGDTLTSGEDFAKSLIKTTLTLALDGPSLNLENTGLFGAHATLAGMLVWLGLVFAAFGFMWQIGKMAITGEGRHLGRAAVGWMQNVLLCTIGVSLVAMLLSAGDQVTDGLVDAVFGSNGAAYDRIVKVLVPAGIENPVIVAVGLAVLLLVGCVQLALVFLRQSAIPIQCLLLPIAGAGRVGGDSVRQWTPRLITSILVIIIYKPILAIIICTGFAEFGNAVTPAEWLRGVATLLLGILAPAPLTKIFAPLGAEVGGGMAVGGAIGAVAGMGAKYMGGKSGGGGGEGDAPTSPVEHAKHVEQTMPQQGGGDGGGGSQEGAGGDALAQASRTQAAQVPGPAKAPDAGGAPSATGAGSGAGPGAGAEIGTGVGTGVAGSAGATGAATGAAAAAGPVGAGIAVLDGINSGVQKGAGEMGGGSGT